MPRFLGAQTPVPGSPGRIERVPQLPPRVMHELARRGWAEDPRLAVGLFVAAGVVALAWVGAARLAHRRGRRLTALPRWPTRLGVSAALTLLVVAGGAVAVNSYVGYVPTFGAVTGTSGGSSAVVAAGDGRGAPAASDGSTLLKIHIDGSTPGMLHRSAYVYLPPGYASRAAAHRRYPVVYLIHGSPGSAIDWVRAGRLQHTMDTLLAAHLVRPMIVVAPTAATSWRADDECLNIPGGAQLETYLARSVVGGVDARFRTLPDRRWRAIAGMSSGAFCALNVGLHHPHRFSVVLASEPYPNAGTGPLRKLLHGDRALWLANAPSYYIPYLPFRQRVSVFLDSGTADHEGTRTAELLAHELAARGQLVGLRLAPGLRHTWYTARLELPYALVFASRHFGDAANGGSDAADAATFRGILALARAQQRAASKQPPATSLLKTPPGSHRRAAPATSPSRG